MTCPGPEPKSFLMVNKEKKQTFSEPEVWPNSVHLTAFPGVACTSRIIASELGALEIFGLVISLHIARIILM